MNRQTLALQIVGIGFVFLLLAGCGGPAAASAAILPADTPTVAAPVATATAVPPTATPTLPPPTATPRPTATPKPAATPEPTEKPKGALRPKPAAPPQRDATLYLCSDEDFNVELVRDCAQNGITQLYFYPGESSNSSSIEYVLPGDIAGAEYRFHLYLASKKQTTFKVTIAVRHAGQETTLASTTFTARSTYYTEFTKTVQGIDPATVRGDVLIFRITAVSGAQGGIAFTNDSVDTSYIRIPPVS